MNDEIKSQVLYGEEDLPDVVRLYDVDTGSEFQQSVDALADVEQQQALRDSEALKALKLTHGWAIIEEFLKTYNEHWTDQLIVEKDLAEVVRIQQALQAYRGLLSFVDAKIIEGEKFAEERT